MVIKKTIVRRVKRTRRIIRRSSAGKAPRVLKVTTPRSQKSPGGVRTISGAAKKNDILRRFQEERKNSDKGSKIPKQTP